MDSGEGVALWFTLQVDSDLALAATLKEPCAVAPDVKVNFSEFQAYKKHFLLKSLLGSGAAALGSVMVSC